MTLHVTMLLLVSVTAKAQVTRPVVSAAKGPRPTAVVLRAVDERLAQRDSLGALDVLDSALAYDRRNGPLWNRYGQIAWEMSKREGGLWMRPDMIRLRIRSDSAFRYATAFSPDSAAYFLDLGKYALETNLVWIRQGARGTYEDGVKIAEAQGRKDIVSPLLDGLGMFHWRLYDGGSRRASAKPAEIIGETAVPMPVGTTGRQLDAEVSSPIATPARAFREDYGAYYRDRFTLMKPVTGEPGYILARRKFEDAIAADPGNLGARRHLYMAMADHAAWQDLLREADRTLRVTEGDVDAWLARGVAAAGLEDYESAAKAFEMAMRGMSNGERAYYTNVKRLLSPSSDGRTKRFADSLHWDSLSEAERRRQETLFWNLADPRPMTRVNEALVEFYARIAYADLRFGSEEYRIRGSESDRGRIWIRYGPPSEHFSIGGSASDFIIWIYDRPSAAFTFEMRRTFGTAYHDFTDVSVDSILTENPVGFGNMTLARRTWPMRMRTARFRSSRDSMDVVVTATVPVRSFLEGAELGGALPINVQLDVHDPAARIIGRETRKVTVRMDSLPVGINGAWVRRLGRGANVVRVDAEQPDVNRAASSTADASVDTTSGFGISDLMLGTNPQRTGNTDPKRWNDVSIAPTTGVFPWAQSLGVVWEVYDLAPADGSVKYRVNVLLERTFKSPIISFMAKVGTLTKNVIQGNGASTGSIAVAYNQSRPASAIVTDYVSVNLDGSVPGTYKLTIEIEDLVSKRVTKRTTPFVLTKD